MPTQTLTQANPRDRVARLQRFTLAWMTVELIVAVGSGVAAKSPALVAFGGDSAIELFSAWLVLRRFKAGGDGSEGATARWTAWLLGALDASHRSTSRPSILRQFSGHFRGVPLAGAAHSAAIRAVSRRVAMEGFFAERVCFAIL